MKNPRRPPALASFWPHRPAQAPLGRRGRPKKSRHSRGGFFILGDPGAIRTRDRLLRRQMLYPAELRDRGRKNREIPREG